MLGSTPKRFAILGTPSARSGVLFKGDRYPRAAKLLALFFGPTKPGTHAFMDHRALELGEDPHHLKERFAGGHGGIQPLLVQEEIDAGGVDLRQEADQVLR